MPKVYSNFTKARNVACLMYLSDWGKSYGELLEYLDELHMPCACSPIHNADEYSQTDVNLWVKSHMSPDGSISEAAKAEGMPRVGQHKKDHVHVLASAKGPITAEAWYEKFELFHPITYFLNVNSVPSMLRYFAHMDSPEKHQYSVLDIHGFGGIDLSPLLQTDKVSNIHTLMSVLDYVKENKVHHYNQVVKYAISTGDMELIACVTGRASFFANFFKSESDENRYRKRWKQLQKKYPQITDEELKQIYF